MVRNILLIVLLFFFLYYPPLFPVNTLHILASIAFLYLAFKRESRDKLFYIWKKSYLLLIAFAYLIIRSILSENYYGAVGVFVLFFEVIPISVFLLEMQKKSGTSLINLLIIVASIQSLMSFSAFFFPEIQGFFLQRFVSNGFNDVFVKMAGWRMFGFSYTMAYAMPVVQAAIASMCLFKALNEKVWYIIPMIFILFSSIINARTGIVVFVICSIGVLLNSFEISVKKLALLLFAVVVLSFIPIVFLNVLSSNENTEQWVKSGVNDIGDFVNGNEYEKGNYFAYVQNENKYQLPSNIIEIIFGTGLITTRGNDSIQSDVGFVNDLWLGGLIYVFLIMTFYLKNTCFCVNELVSQNKYRAMVVLIVLLFCLNIKGRCFSWN